MPKNADAVSSTAGSKTHSLLELGLLDSPPEAGYDAITRLANRLFDTPVALVSIIDEANDRQYFKSQLGLGEPWATARQTPLSHSFCQHVKSSDAPLIISEAPNHPLVCDNLAIRDLDVIAYLGIPISDPQGQPIGALCVIDSQPRIWTDNDVALLSDLGQCVGDEIKLRAADKLNTDLIAKLNARQKTMERYNAMRESIVLAFMAPDLGADQRFQALLTEGARALGMDRGAIARIPGGQANCIFTATRDGNSVEPKPVSAHRGLYAEVASGTAMRGEADISRTPLAGRLNLFGLKTGAFVAAPIVLDGLPYGIMEFSSDAPRSAPWSEEDLSIVAGMSMFAAAHLSLHGEISALQRSETALVGKLLETRQLVRDIG